MRILVTGGNGFLGRNIILKLLPEGHEVVSLQRSDLSVIPAIDGVEYLQRDLSELEPSDDCFDGVDVVFHVAALAGYWGAWEEYERANVTATENVYSACKEAGVRKLIYTSTPSVVFSGDHLEGADERTPYGEVFLCHYARSKRMAEEWILTKSGVDGMDVVALRPHLIWGAEDPHLVPRLIRRARAGKLMQVGKGRNRVDLTHVVNAAEAHVAAMNALIAQPGKVGGKAYFISDGEPVVLWNWVNQLLEAMGIERLKKKISFPLAYRIGHLLEISHRMLGLDDEPRMTRFLATELSKDHFFDISSAKKDLGYEPSVDLEKEFRAMIDYLTD